MRDDDHVDYGTNASASNTIEADHNTDPIPAITPAPPIYIVFRT